MKYQGTTREHLSPYELRQLMPFKALQQSNFKLHLAESSLEPQNYLLSGGKAVNLHV